MPQLHRAQPGATGRVRLLFCYTNHSTLLFLPADFAHICYIDSIHIAHSHSLIGLTLCVRCTLHAFAGDWPRRIWIYIFASFIHTYIHLDLDIDTYCTCRDRHKNRKPPPQPQPGCEPPPLYLYIKFQSIIHSHSCEWASGSRRRRRCRCVGAASVQCVGKRTALCARGCLRRPGK